MNDTEARFKCLELSVTLLKPQGMPTEQAIVETAKVLYAFVANAPQPPATESETVDKPSKGGRPRKHPDILS